MRTDDRKKGLRLSQSALPEMKARLALLNAAISALQCYQGHSEEDLLDSVSDARLRRRRPTKTFFGRSPRHPRRKGLLAFTSTKFYKAFVHRPEALRALLQNPLQVSFATKNSHDADRPHVWQIDNQKRI